MKDVAAFAELPDSSGMASVLASASSPHAERIPANASALMHPIDRKRARAREIADLAILLGLVMDSSCSSARAKLRQRMRLMRKGFFSKSDITTSHRVS
ncbi:MAG: hypothetical protein ACLU8U_04265 [Adlercreutzia equolifaciens]